MRALCAIAATALACAPSHLLPSHERAAIACGAGLTAASRATPRGLEAWCEDERGVRTGPFERQFPRGQLAERGRYAAGALDGDYESFYASGAPHERGRYARGRRDGAWRAWHENGKPWLEVTYAAGQPAGPWLEHDYTGDTMFEGTYRDGRLEGEWRGYRGTNVVRNGASRDGKLDGVVRVTYPDGSDAVAA